jgi:flagellar biosynthesis protein
MQIDLDQHIPPQLYRAVAELLAWLYRIENGSVNPSVNPFARDEQNKDQGREQMGD